MKVAPLRQHARTVLQLGKMHRQFLAEPARRVPVRTCWPSPVSIPSRNASTGIRNKAAVFGFTKIQGQDDNDGARLTKITGRYRGRSVYLPLSAMTAPSGIADDQPRHTRALGAVAGVLAAAVAIGAAQFASGLGVPQSSPVFAVGQAAIDLAPPQVKEFAISAFGADDKTVLLGGILVVVALYAAVVGMLAVRRLAFGMCGLAIFASIGLAAALTRPTATVDLWFPPWWGPRPARSR